jgi:hypothetical protein
LNPEWTLLDVGRMLLLPIKKDEAWYQKSADGEVLLKQQIGLIKRR